MNTNTTSPTNVTRTIAGREITLPTGWYIAARPMAERGRTTYPITIYGEGWTPALTLPAMTYDAANTFLAEFNNGDMSFDGRTW